MNIRSITYYSKFVNLTKLLLGILVVALTSMILFYPVIKKNTGIRIAFTSSSEKNTPPPTKMINANFHGFDSSNQPYNLTAKTATQIDTDNVLFNNINGDIALNNGVWLTTQANTGSLTIKEQMLKLSGAVEMFNDQGYEMHTQSMVIDIGKKIAITTDPVTGQGPLGTLKATGATFDGNAKTALFGGRVTVTIHLPPKNESSKDLKGNS